MSNYRHGHKKADGASREYVTWNGMRARCHNPNDPKFSDYGGRGISVCDRWRNDFVAFLKDMGPKPANSSIERIDNNGDYERKNCRWATMKEQCNNRRSSRHLTFRGKTKTLSGWADTAGLSISTLHARLTLGWDVERAITTPLRGLARKDQRAAWKPAIIHASPFEAINRKRA